MNIKGVVADTSEWLVGNGSWLFPITLLLLSFFLRWGWGRDFSKMNFFKLIMVFPIDIKITACTFVLAAMVLNPSDPFGVGGFLILGLVLLGGSIGFYNHLRIESRDNNKEKYTNIYLIASTFISILMLVFSILVMQAYENKAAQSSLTRSVNSGVGEKGVNHD